MTSYRAIAIPPTFYGQPAPADNKLISNAKNEELKAMLVKVRPSLVSHLEHAKKIQGMLGGK
jgi:hypothetical protein